MPGDNVARSGSHLLHGIDFLVDELSLGQQGVGRRVVFFELRSQPLGVRQYLLNGDGHCVFDVKEGKGNEPRENN